MATPRSTAQSFFSDNELRTEIIEMSSQLKDTEATILNLESSLATLRQEQELLRELISEIYALVTQATDKATERQDAMQKLTTKITTKIATLEEKYASELNLLGKLIEGMDAAAYARALTNYSNAGNPVETLAQLNRIVALGEQSSYKTAAMHWIGRIHYEQGEFNAARTTLTQLLENHPGHLREANTLYLLAEIATLLDDPLQATWRERLLHLHPTSLAADKIRSLPNIPATP